MERWAKPKTAPPPPPQRQRYQPSFSSSLLDAIYRSIDGESDAASTDTAAAAVARQYEPSYKTTVTVAARKYEPSYKTTAAPARRGGGGWRGWPNSTSSSSDCSSYGGFSSSEAESSAPPTAHRLRPIRTAARPAPAPAPEKKTKKPSSIRSKLRDFHKSRSPAASPGARLASFLNSIFSAKSPAAARMPPPQPQESACSTASSYSRSCLSKTPSTRDRSAAERRTVRFVDEDWRKDLPGDRRRRAASPEKRADELLRELEMEMETDDEESDASSDLFELENLAAISPRGRDGGGAAGELPVYETTSLGLGFNRAIGCHSSRVR